MITQIDLTARLKTLHLEQKALELAQQEIKINAELEKAAALSEHRSEVSGESCS